MTTVRLEDGSTVTGPVCDPCLAGGLDHFLHARGTVPHCLDNPRPEPAPRVFIPWRSAFAVLLEDGSEMCAGCYYNVPQGYPCPTHGLAAKPA